MFYLLEDNRIIDISNLEKEKMKYIKFPTKDKPYNEGSYLLHEDTQYIKIKKQSEHVYYLIDWKNDLVRNKDGDVISCSQLFIFYMQEYIDKQLFTAIYKPNSNGDYIKVWEKKDEKES